MVSLMEHCTDDIRDEVFVDGQSGVAVTNGAALIAGPRIEVMDPGTLGEDETIVVPPEQRASAIVRQLLAKMLRPLQADTVHEESLAMDHIELFYRPIVAFEFHLPAKDRRGVVEVDGADRRGEDGVVAEDADHAPREQGRAVRHRGRHGRAAGPGWQHRGEAGARRAGQGVLRARRRRPRQSGPGMMGACPRPPPLPPSSRRGPPSSSPPACAA